MATKREWRKSIKLVEDDLDNPAIPGAVFWNAACSYLYLGKYDLALISITKCVEREYRTSGIAWLIQGLLAHLCGETSIRNESMREAVRISPKQLVYYAGILREIGVEAEELFVQQALPAAKIKDEELTAEYSSAITQAKQLLRDQKELQAAEQFTQFSPRNIADIPEVVDIAFGPIILPTCPAQLYDYKELFVSGVSAFRRRGYEEAIQRFEELYSKTAGSYPAAVNWTAALIATERYSHAIEILSNTVEPKGSGGAYAIRNLISALVKSGKPGDAYPWFGRLLEASSREYFNFVQMAYVAQLIGRREEIATALYNACTITLSEPSIHLKGAAIRACIEVKDHDRAVALAKYFTKEITPPYVIAGRTRPAIPAKDCVRYAYMVKQYNSFDRSGDKRAALAYFSEVHPAREADFSNEIKAETVDALFNACMYYGRSLFWNEDFDQAHEILRQALGILTEHSNYYPRVELSKRYFALTNVYFLRKHYFWALELCERGLEADTKNRYLLELRSKIQEKIEKIPEDSRVASQEIAELPLSVCKTTAEFLALLPKVSQLVRQLPQDFPDSRKPIAELIDIINGLIGLESIALIPRKEAISRLEAIMSRVEVELPLYLPKTFISALLPVLKGAKKALSQIKARSVCPEFTFTLEPIAYCREAEATLVYKLRNTGPADIHKLQIKIESELFENWAPMLEEQYFENVKKDEQLWIDWPIYFDSPPEPETEITPKPVLRFTGGALRGEIVEQDFSEQVAKLIPFFDINVGYPVIALKPVENNRLYGRENLLRGLGNSFSSSGQTRIPFLEGVRHVGKTSILYFLAARLNGDLLPVYVNLDTTWHSPFQLFARRVAEEISVTKGLVSPSVGEIDTKDDFRQFITNVMQQSGIRGIVLLLDEFHIVIDRIDEHTLSSRFLGDLRDMYMSPQQSISIVFADWYMIDELKSRVSAQMWTDFAREPISFLSEIDARAAILTPAQGSPLRFERQSISKIYYHTAGYPWHIQWICSELIIYLNTQKRYIVLPQDVDLIASRLLREDRLFNEGVCRPERLSPDSQRAIYAILETLTESNQDIRASFPKDSIISLRLPIDVDREVSRLIQLEILHEHENQMRFCSPVHALWLDEKRRKNIDICSVRGAKDGHETVMVELPTDPPLEIRRKCEELRQLKSQIRVALQSGTQIFKNVDMPNEWANASITVQTPDTWGTFVKALRDLFVEDMTSRLDSWDDRKQYPDLYEELHSIRLRRNYVEHPKSEEGIKEEERCCLRDIDKRFPTCANDWIILQIKTLDRLINVVQGIVRQAASI